MNKTLKYFNEIAKIPRCSGNEKNIAKYLCEFAKHKGLEFFADEFDNVIIKKKTSNFSPIIVQAHTDMVCVKSKDSEVNFENQGISLCCKKGYLTAIDTSLGADNGIGVAMILSLLDENFPMNIEAVFTSSEETTMKGAMNLDYSKLKAKYILSLDGSVENEVVTSSASMTEIEINFESISKTIEPCNAYCLKLYNFKSGHSGEDIDKCRLNPISLFFNYFKKNEFNLHDININEKSNVLPNEMIAIFSYSKFDIKDFDNYIKEENERYSESVKYELFNQITNNLIDSNFVKKLKSFKNGVIKKNNQNVICSCNIYFINLKNSKIKLSLRANKKSLEEKFLNDLNVHFSNSKIKILDSKPFFEKSKNNLLLSKLLLTNKNAYEKEIHAGLEGGIFAENIKNCEICVIGVTILNMHTINEKVELNSIKNVYQWLVKTIQSIDF